VGVTVAWCGCVGFATIFGLSVRVGWISPWMCYLVIEVGLCGRGGIHGGFKARRVLGVDLDADGGGGLHGGWWGLDVFRILE